MIPVVVAAAAASLTTGTYSSSSIMRCSVFSLYDGIQQSKSGICFIGERKVAKFGEIFDTEAERDDGPDVVIFGRRESDRESSSSPSCSDIELFEKSSCENFSLGFR